MKQEIDRIRANDLSAVDTQLFQNQEKIESLDVSLTHLSELQQFLLSQINLIQKQKTNSPSDAQHRKLQEQCDFLKESIIRMPFNEPNLKREDIKSILSTAVQAKEDFQAARKIILEQITAYKQFMEILFRETHQKTASQQKELLESIEKLKQENDLLNRQNRTLKRTNEEWEQARMARRSKNSRSSQHTHKIDQIQTHSKHDQNTIKYKSVSKDEESLEDYFQNSKNFVQNWNPLQQLVQYKSIAFTQSDANPSTKQGRALCDIVNQVLERTEIKRKFTNHEISKKSVDYLNGELNRTNCHFIRGGKNMVPAQKKRSDSKQKIEVLSKRH